MSGSAVAAAREDFTNRIGRQVRSMSRAGRMTTWEWTELSGEFLDYLGALSLASPRLDTPEAKAVLHDAAEAAAGAVAYAAYYPHNGFSVFLDYVNFGMSYDAGEDGDPESVSAGTWLDAFCLTVLDDRAQWHGEAFHFAREIPQTGRAGRPDAELINGFMAYVIGDTGDDDAGCPPSQQERCAALDAALARIGTLDDEAPEDLLDAPGTTALHALRALATDDRAAFKAALAKLLAGHSALTGTGLRPRTLLPLVPLTLAALAHRGKGWPPAVDSDYLPRALVTGFETAGPRVQAYGRARRPDAVAELAAGTVVFERPENPHPIALESEALFEEHTREAFTPVAGKPPATWQLAFAMDDQELLFKARASLAPDVTERHARGLRLASQMGAALFRTALADPGTTVDVRINGATVTYAAYRGEDAGPGRWHKAVNLALVTGVREDLAPLVIAGPASLAEDGSAFASYRRALLDYLRGADPEPATDQALHDFVKAKGWGFFPPPVTLFSQLVEGDEESFNLALLDALEEHRDHYLVADRASDADAALSLDILALACHARRRGWTVRVASPYLPPRILSAATPL
ncbi:Imm49 family immunity protein [Streptomyces sp. NPDC059785]|uniref:immunity 49 family protein n=1 Tax=Streptomyces sp. NPDC059785 TaxID=3346945 RepID=UPI0036479C5B